MYNLLTTKNRILLIFAHMAFAYFLVIQRGVAQYAILFIFALCIWDVIKTQDKGYRALFYIVYFGVLEVVFRMTKTNFSYEFGKYAVMAFSIIGAYFRGRSSERVESNNLTLYMALLLPSIAILEAPDMIEFRKSVMFNLSGPAALFFSVRYVLRLTGVMRKSIEQIHWASYLGGIVLLAVLFIKSPNLSSIDYSSESNFAASGGFGPNQVSTTIGFVIVLLLIGILRGIKQSGFLLLDYLVLGLLLLRGIMTFSRGGIVAALMAILIYLIVGLFDRNKAQNKKSVLSVIAPVFLGLILIGVWGLAEDYTGGMINNRFQGQNQRGKQEDFTSGRLEISGSEIEAFNSSPILGIGPGGGKYYRKQEYGISAASHSEITRVLGEHGIIGGISFLCLILAVAYRGFFNMTVSVEQKKWALALAALGFMTMLHAALRLSLPPVMFCLAFLSFNLIDEKDSDIIHRE